MTTTTDIGALITSSPEIRQGRPRIAGTGVTVHRIAVWYKLGVEHQDIVERVSAEASGHRRRR